VLTVECASSIWAQELTYLGRQLLARMNELDPAHPVRRFRFVTRRAPAAREDERGGQSAGAPSGSLAQENQPAAANNRKRDVTIDRADLGAAEQSASEVGDERLRKAIQAALGAAADRPPEAAPGGSVVNQKK